jgi:hypothetical protein
MDDFLEVVLAARAEAVGAAVMNSYVRRRAHRRRLMQIHVACLVLMPVCAGGVSLIARMVSPALGLWMPTAIVVPMFVIDMIVVERYYRLLREEIHRVYSDPAEVRSC